MIIKSVVTAYFEIEDDVYVTLTEDEVGEAVQDGRIKPTYVNVNISDDDGKVLEDCTFEEELLEELREDLKNRD